MLSGVFWSGSAGQTPKFCITGETHPMLILGRIIIVVCMWLGLAVSAQDELVDERILLTFIPNVQFAPFYVGIEDGYFAGAGFNVSLAHLQEPEVLDLVAVGQANFGIVSGEQVILARSRGRDVVYVFEWFQQYPVGLVYSSALDLRRLDHASGNDDRNPGPLWRELQRSDDASGQRRIVRSGYRPARNRLQRAGGVLAWAPLMPLSYT